MSFKALAWAIEQTDVAGLEKFVLTMIAYRDSHDYPHGCYPSMERIASDCGISRSTVAEHLNSLEEKGKIRRTQRFNGQGGLTSNFYDIPEVWDGGSESRGGSPKSGRGVVQRSDRGSPAVGQGVVRNPDYPSPESGHKPAVEPSVEPSSNPGEKGVDSTPPPKSTPREETPPEEEDAEEDADPQESYKTAQKVYRRNAKGKLGSLGESQMETWAALISNYGEKAVLGALGLWAHELGSFSKKLDYPIGVFLKKAKDHLEAYEIQCAPPTDEQEDDDRMLTGKDILREREEREKALKEEREKEKKRG